VNFVRKAGWRLICLILAALVAVCYSPRNFLSAEMTQEQKSSYSVAVLLSLVIGFLFKRLRWFHHIDTWIHEFGHATMVTIFGGQPKYIKLNQDSSGVTSFRQTKFSPFRDVVISAAGPLASVFALYVSSMLVMRGLVLVELQTFAFVVLLVLISTVRSAFGWVVGILIWASMAVSVGLGLSAVLGLHFGAAPEVYVGAVLGLGAGVAIRASFSRLRFAGPNSDEGKISYHVHLPVSLVVWVLAAMNLFVVWSALSLVDLANWHGIGVLGSLDIQREIQQLIAWVHSIKITQ